MPELGSFWSFSQIDNCMMCEGPQHCFPIIKLRSIIFKVIANFKTCTSYMLFVPPHPPTPQQMLATTNELLLISMAKAFRNVTKLYDKIQYFSPIIKFRSIVFHKNNNRQNSLEKKNKVIGHFVSTTHFITFFL